MQTTLSNRHPPAASVLGEGCGGHARRTQTSRAFPEKRDEAMAVATQPQIDVQDNSLAGARAWFAQKGLSRPREGRFLAGVSAGFARRYDINPLVARLLGILGVVVRAGVTTAVTSPPLRGVDPAVRVRYPRADPRTLRRIGRPGSRSLNARAPTPVLARSLGARTVRKSGGISTSALRIRAR
jgi:phage shock protein PspC (stress-responsive transcriptional regulator)